MQVAIGRPNGRLVDLLVDDSWPGAAVIFADIASPVALAFLTRYPTPESACHLGEKRMAAFCASHGYSGRRTVGELLEQRARQALTRQLLVADDAQDQDN